MDNGSDRPYTVPALTRMHAQPRLRNLHDGREQGMAKAKRTTHRSSSGTKLYAVRDSKGRFKDIQTYKKAHGADLKRKSKAETKKKK